MGQTVNLLATPSVVRIHPLPQSESSIHHNMVDCSFVVLGGGVLDSKVGRYSWVATFGVREGNHRG